MIRHNFKVQIPQFKEIQIKMFLDKDTKVFVWARRQRKKHM